MLLYGVTSHVRLCFGPLKINDRVMGFATSRFVLSIFAQIWSLAPKAGYPNMKPGWYGSQKAGNIDLLSGN